MKLLGLYRGAGLMKLTMFIITAGGVSQIFSSQDFLVFKSYIDMSSRSRGSNNTYIYSNTLKANATQSRPSLQTNHSSIVGVDAKKSSTLILRNNMEKVPDIDIVYPNKYQYVAVEKPEYSDKSRLLNRVAGRHPMLFEKRNGLGTDDRLIPVNTFWERAQSHRTDRVKEICAKDKTLKNKGVISDYFKRKAIVDWKKKILFCPIPGVASSSIKTFLLNSTFQENTKIKLDASDLNNYTFMAERCIYSFQKLSWKQQKTALEVFSKFVVVRHPFERLVSVYIDKFMQKNKWSRYFQKKFTPHIIKHYRKTDGINERRKDKMTLGEFVHFVSDFKERSLSNSHWTTFYDLCSPCSVNYDYILKLENLDREASEFLQTLHTFQLNGQVRLPTHVISDSRRQAKKLLIEELKTTEATLKQKLAQKFLYDFKLFGYSPNIDDVKS